jgi:hypothetical protein
MSLAGGAEAQKERRNPSLKTRSTGAGTMPGLNKAVDSKEYSLAEVRTEKTPRSLNSRSVEARADLFEPLIKHVMNFLMPSVEFRKNFCQLRLHRYLIKVHDARTKAHHPRVDLLLGDRLQ